MMDFALQTAPAPSPLTPEWGAAQIAVVLGDRAFLLDDGSVARQAASCVITPEVGDRILSFSCRDGSRYVLHVLERDHEETAELAVPGTRQLTICQPQIALYAGERIVLHALRDVDVTAAAGVLSLNARNLFATVHDTLVQNMRHYIGRAEQYLLDVKQLLKLHGQHALITADQDVKVDGERISMG